MENRAVRTSAEQVGSRTPPEAVQVVSLGLGSVTVGAFLDDRVNELIGVDGERETAIYLQAVGRP